MKKATVCILGAALLVALASLPGYGQKAQNSPGNKEALAVLNKMIEAMGGRKSLESIKDTTISGTAEITQFGISAPVTIYQKEPDKIRMDITIAEANMTITQAFDGQKGWWTNPQSGGITEEMPDFLTKIIAREAVSSQAMLNPQKAGVTYALKPKATIEGKDYVVLEQTLADGHKNTFFLDPETYLPYKVETKSIDETGGEADAETYSSNYQKVGGIMVAHSMRVLLNGSESRRITLTSVTYNTNLDDALFKLK